MNALAPTGADVASPCELATAFDFECFGPIGLAADRGERLPSRADAGEESERRYIRLPPIQWPEFSRLQSDGATVEALIWPNPPARADVVFHPQRSLFDFADDVGDEDAVSALVFLALGEAGEPEDLVAWTPQPNRLASWHGAAAFLGAEDLLAPRVGVEGLLVHPDPLEWLRAGRSGVVILDPARARWRLAGEPLIVRGVDFGRKVRASMRLPVPRVFVERRAE
jgi:hypothetical protein